MHSRQFALNISGSITVAAGLLFLVTWMAAAATVALAAEDPSPVATREVTPTRPPRATSMQIRDYQSPTPTDTPIPTITPTFTPIPTATSIPTVTPTSAPSVTPTTNIASITP